MVNANLMYFRPGNLLKDFIIEENIQTVTASGRAVVKYSGDGSKTLKGCLADATEEDRGKRSLSDHTVTHTIVQNGFPRAKRSDKLILGDRVFYIVDLDDTGMFGIATLYYVEERRDIK